VHTKALVL